MAATYAQLATIANLSTFTSRVAYAMASQAAMAYAAGPKGSTSYNFAVKVANGNYSLQAACNAVLTNATVLNDITAGGTDSTILDADIQTAVATVWNLLAGV
jgi:hypothetical protein